VAAHFQVSVTAPSADEAGRLGRIAVEQRLAACAQVSGPITSTYWWEGKVQSATEWLCVLKTTAPLMGRLTGVLREAHSYEVPEIVAVPIEAGDEDYLAWVSEETGQAGQTGETGQGQQAGQPGQAGQREQAGQVAQEGQADQRELGL